MKTRLTLLVLAATAAAVPFDSSTCFVSKGCFLPHDCIPGDASNDCPMAFSYRPLNDSFVEMELYASPVPDSDNFYVAVAFSDDRKMGGEPVTECSRLAGESDLSIKASYNYASHAKKINKKKKKSKGNKRIEEEEAVRSTIFSSSSASVVDGGVYCRWTQRIKGLSLAAEYFESDLSTPFYFLLAKGTTNSEGLKCHHKNKKVPKAPLPLSFKPSSPAF